MDKKQISNIKQRGFDKKFWKDNIAKVCQIKGIEECFDQLMVLNVHKSGSVVEVEPNDLKLAIDEFVELRGLMKKALAKCGPAQKTSKLAINEYIKQIDTEHKNLLKLAAKVTGIEASAARKDGLLKLKKIQDVFEEIEKPIVDRSTQCDHIRAKILQDHNDFVDAGDLSRGSGKKRWDELHKYMQIMPVATLKKMFEQEFPKKLDACIRAMGDVDKKNADIAVERKKLETRLTKSRDALRQGQKNFKDMVDTFAGIRQELQKLSKV